MQRSSATFVVVLLAFGLSAQAQAQVEPQFGDPVPLAQTENGGNDKYPQIASDGAGHWIAVWQSTAQLGVPLGLDFDILITQSTDHGSTWSGRAPLNSNAATDDGWDEDPQIATDRTGNWVVVWKSKDDLGGTIGTDYDLLVARSADDGVTWSDPIPLNTDADTDTINEWDFDPQLLTDGSGTWLVVWTVTRIAYGAEADLFFSRSLDGGATWSDSAPLNSNAATDSGSDAEPSLATDGEGRWIVVWSTNEQLNGATGDDKDIVAARSVDGGVTWSDPLPLHPDVAEDVAHDFAPGIATDGAGIWIVAWSAIVGHTSQGDDWNIHWSKSTDQGASWTIPQALNTNAAFDTQNDYSPQIATDGAGRWIVVWYGSDLYEDDHDIHAARSEGAVSSWSPPEALNSNAATDTWYDWVPQLTMAGQGHWVAVWHSQGDGEPFDVMIARGAVCELQLEGASPTMVHFPPSSHIASGSLLQLRDTGQYADATCIASFTDSPGIDPRGLPHGGEVWYYLARGVGHCASYGDSSLSPDPRDDLDAIDPCP